MKNQPVARHEFDLLVNQMKEMRRAITLLQNVHTPTMPVYDPDFPDDAVEAQHAFRNGKPRYFKDGLWHPRLMYVTPVAPADEPDDYGEQGDDDYPAWESPWANIGADYDASAFTNFYGHFWMRIAATGGESTPESLMFTLPIGHRPPKIRRFIGQVGASGEQLATVRADPDGSVVFLNAFSV